MLEAMGLGQGPSESRRMVTEKMAAVTEGAFAANVAWQRLWWRTSLAMCGSGVMPSPAEAAQLLTTAALAPADKRVRANVKRLSKPKSARKTARK